MKASSFIASGMLQKSALPQAKTGETKAMSYDAGQTENRYSYVGCAAEESEEPELFSAMKPAVGTVDREAPKLKWTKIFQMQHRVGYWEYTTELGEAINFFDDMFIYYLDNIGINSLGVNARANILRLVATLLVLQLMRLEELEEGKLLRTLFCLDDSSQPRSDRWEQVQKAVQWVRWADREYPCVCTRLEFGFSWESATRQLLGYERLPPFSPLRGLDLHIDR